MRVLFFINVSFWWGLLIGWLAYVGIAGMADPVSVQVEWILAATAVLLTAQGIIRWRRRRAIRVSA